MSEHARLSPSASARWLTCTASVELVETLPPDEGSIYAAEGAYLHGLAEIELDYRLGKIPRRTYTRRLNAAKASEDGQRFQTLEATAVVKNAVDMVEAELEDMGGFDAVLLERKLDLRRWVPDGFGTGDVIAIRGDLLHVIDYKFGAGVPVAAANNSQLMLYGLGALDAFGPVYDIARVRVTVIQPRLHNISSFELTAKELLAWGDDVVKPAASAASTGDGATFAPSDKACRWCAAKSICRARTEQTLAEDFNTRPATLSDGELAELLTRIPMISAWCRDVEAYALASAKAGTHYPGFKLVEGRSTRRIVDQEAALERLADVGFPAHEVTKPTELLGITALAKIVGPELDAVLGDAITKPPGAPTLVPADDKRPEIGSVSSAASDFA